MPCRIQSNLWIPHGYLNVFDKLTFHVKIPYIMNQDLACLDLSTVLGGLAPATRRAYASRLARFRMWTGSDTLIDRSIVKRYLAGLELSGASNQVINGHLAAIKYLVRELHESARVDSTTYAGIQSIRFRPVRGVRVRRWLSIEQCAALLSTIRAQSQLSTKGARDAALIALLLGCGLRRSEACALAVEQVRTIDGRMMLVNVKGKAGRTRSVSVPRWAQSFIDAWITITSTSTHNQVEPERILADH
jgi:site-specific recombinase XerD